MSILMSKSTLVTLEAILSQDKKGGGEGEGRTKGKERGREKWMFGSEGSRVRAHGRKILEIND